MASAVAGDVGQKKERWKEGEEEVVVVRGRAAYGQGSRTQTMKQVWPVIGIVQDA